ncbi:hypothetical protein H0H92_012549 [Tricholoma furcatifolium]|nr:hypothetical protein H0H92_012549 [Tricholoma furcatifolium]
MNDELSFYKEEMKRETRNYVNILKANLKKKSKYTVLAQAAREAVEAHSRASSLLQDEIVSSIWAVECICLR